MIVINPNYVSPVAAWAAANKNGVNAWLAAAPQSGMSVISFDYIRANAAGMATKTDGELAELCKALGLVVER
jgi:hypothetical protein